MTDGAPTAGYAQPWVVQPGAPVALHASLPQRTRVDVVRLVCANTEQCADGSAHGPATRIVPVAEAIGDSHGPAPQRLVPGGQVLAACAALPPWPRLCLVLAVQRLAQH